MLLVGTNEISVNMTDQEVHDLRVRVSSAAQRLNMIFPNAAIVMSGIIPCTSGADEHTGRIIHYLNGEWAQVARGNQGYFIFPKGFY